MAKVDYGTLPPIPTRGEDGRLRAVRYGKVINSSLMSQAELEAMLPAQGTPLPGYPALALVSVSFGLPPEGDSWPRFAENYTEATADLLELSASSTGDDLDAQLQTSGTDCREITRRYVTLASAAAGHLVQIIPPALFDAVYAQARIVAQAVKGRGDRTTAIVIRRFAEIPTPIDDPKGYNGLFPGLEDGSYGVIDEFPFRSRPESVPTVARVRREYFPGPLEQIERIPEFRAVDEDGNATDILTESTSPTAEDYLGWVKTGRELVMRCEISRWQGDIFERSTFYVPAR